MSAYREKIIQFGEGAFLRGFADWIVQILNEKTDFNASAVVVQPIEKGMCQVLERQNCNYTHIMRGMKNGVPAVETKYIDVISRTVEPYKDFESYLKLAENSEFRFVVSNTTEAGIVFDAGDKPENAPYISFPAKVALLLKRRFELGLKGFIFLPCELIDKNGENLKNCILKYAGLWNLGEDLIRFINEENIFCNTLVDRIVTGYPKDEELELKNGDDMLNTSELFHLWVIETKENLLEEIPFDKTDLDIILTEDLERYRTRKVRILNGAHTAMIPYAMLRGIETVRDCMEDEEMSVFVRSCIFDEVIPTLDLPESELISYAEDVFERFRNPYIRHLCASISLNSVSKFKVRVLPTILEYIKRKNKMPDKLLFSFAKLLEFYRTDMPNDDPKVIEIMKKASTKEILANTALWGEDLSFLKEEITRRSGLEK